MMKVYINKILQTKKLKPIESLNYGLIGPSVVKSEVNSVV
jgi:hypothetical protein